MSDKTIRTRVEADISDYQEGMQEAARETREFDQSAGRTSQSTDQMASSVGRAVPALGDLSDVARTARDALDGSAESAFALARMVGGALPLALGTAAAAASVLGVSFLAGDAESARLRQSLALTGSVAGVTAGELALMAREVGELTGSQSQASAVLGDLVKTGKVAAEQLPAVARAIVDMSEAGGEAVGALVKQFSRLADEPVRALRELDEAYHFLTPTIYDQVRALEEQGRREEAAALAQKTAAEAVTQRAEDVKAAAGIMSRAWNTVADVASKAWNAMLNIGRDTPLAEQIAAAEREVARIRALGDDGTGFNDYALEMAESELRALRRKAEESRAAAEAQARHNQDMAVYLQLEEQLLPLQQAGADKTRTLAQALAAYHANLERVRAINPNSTLLDPAAIAAGEAKLRDQFATTNRVAGAAQKAADAYQNLVAELGGLSPNFRKEWDLLSQAFAEGKMGAVGSAEAVARLTEAQGALLSRQQAVREATKAQTDAEKSHQRLIEEGERALVRRIADLDRQADLAEEEVRNYGMAASEIERVTIARLEEARAIAAANGAMPEHLDYLDREIEARRRLMGAVASREEQDRQAEFWRSIDDVARSTFDSIADGGKGLAHRLRDTLNNVFFDWLYQMSVRRWLINISASVSGAGVAGQAFGAAGGLPAGAFGGNPFASTASLYSGFAQSGLGQSIGLSQPDYFGGGTPLTSLGESVGQLAQALPYAYAAYLALGKGQIGSGLGTAVGAYFGGPLGAFVGGQVGSSLNGLFGGGTPHRGGAAYAEIGVGAGLADQFNTPGFGLDWGAYRSRRGGDRSSAVDSSVRALIDATAADIATRAARYGGSGAGLRLTGKFAADGDDASSGGYLVEDIGGRAVFNRTSAYASDASKGFGEYGTDAIRAEVAALKALDLDVWFEGLFDAVDPLTDSLDTLTQVLATADEAAQQVALSEQIRQLASADAAEAARVASLNAWESWFESGERIRQAAADGSLSVAQLAELSAQHYANEVQLLQRITQLSGSASDTFADSRRSLQLDVLDNAGKYDFLDREAASLFERLQSAIDPEAIARLGQQLDRSIDQAIAQLSPEERQARAPELLERYDSVEALVGQRLDVARQETIDAQRAVFDDVTAGAAQVIDDVGRTVLELINAAKASVPKGTIEIVARTAPGIELGYAYSQQGDG